MKKDESNYVVIQGRKFFIPEISPIIDGKIPELTAYPAIGASQIQIISDSTPCSSFSCKTQGDAI